MGFLHRHRGLTPYLLLGPGLLYLGLFFVVPLGFLAYQSLESGLFPHFHFTWAFSNFSSAFSGYHSQLIRSFIYAGIATVACLVLAYPLVYWIAFRAGPWRNLFLLIIVAPFFVTYLVRTLAWLNILADQGPVVRILRDIHVLGPDGRLLATTFAVVAGITYNFFPFMALPLYVSLEQPARGCQGPLREPDASVPACDAAPLGTRNRRGDAPYIHPRRRRLHQRRASRDTQPGDDRERHPGEVP